MYKKGTVVLIKNDVRVSRIVHHVGAKIAIVEEVHVHSTSFGNKVNNYRLKVLYPGGGTGIVAWFADVNLEYICDKIEDLSDLQRLLYNLT